ncbi:hypothetical protein E2A64_07545 [Pseudohoeflea suaedae]|uniref:Glycosyltransferase family 8 protein n=1 Tax=Pseudohoeflea suaedae TaxID=877384 RepID=A0A4V3A7I8_9HYPH|nr:glycosyltransferase [Pseudohoeflea suaedae]TDH38935.1 hypothetical protein E2A64_07545 [Pseudohoeflea suaedae]
MKNAIYMITDLRFVKITGALGSRLSKQWGCDVHVFVEGRGAETVDVPGAANIHIHRNRIKFDLPDDIPVSEKWPRVVFLRNYAPSLLRDYDRILYLDVDMLCEKVDHSIWDIDLPYGFGAVSDTATIDKSPRGTGLSREEWLDRIGVESGRYFNSGMMLIEPARWDIGLLGQRLANYYKNRDVHGIKSQDFLNHALDGRWTELSPRWNYQPPFFELGVDDWVDPVFLHFCTPIKPWFLPDHPGASNRRIAHEEAFFRILDEAGVDPRDVAIPGHYKRIRALRRSFRRILSEKGIRTPKERRERALWSERREKMVRYLRNAQKDHLFADPLALEAEPELSGRLHFDGRNLWLDRQQGDKA